MPDTPTTQSSWTDPEDIKERSLDPASLPKNSTLQLFIDDVERQYRNYYPKIQERIDANLLDINYVKQVVSTIINEFLQTKGAPYQQETQQYTGVASRSVSYNVREARYSLTLELEDYALLAPARNTEAFITLNFSFRGNQSPWT